MKNLKILAVISALILGVSGFFLFVISCGDNDSGNPDDYYHPYGYIEGIYPDLTNERELIFVYNGDTIENRKVGFVSNGMEKPKGIFTFENVIEGEEQTKLTVDLIEAESPDNPNVTRLTFNGVYSMKSKSFNYSGFIEPMMLFLALEEK